MKMNHIEELLGEMTYRQLALKADIPKSTLMRIANEENYPDQLQMIQIARALKRKVTEVFELST